MRRNYRTKPTNHYRCRIGTKTAKITEAMDETPRTSNEIYSRSKIPGVRSVLAELVKRGVVKKALLDGRMRYWLP